MFLRVFWYDLQAAALTTQPALVLGDAKLGKLDGASTSTTATAALELLHLVEEGGGVLHE